MEIRGSFLAPRSNEEEQWATTYVPLHRAHTMSAIVLRGMSTFGVKGTGVGHHTMSAIDPKRTCDTGEEPRALYSVFVCEAEWGLEN
jgi:hypothetical protein